jgi:hypothetical protein
LAGGQLFSGNSQIVVDNSFPNLQQVAYATPTMAGHYSISANASDVLQPGFEIWNSESVNFTIWAGGYAIPGYVNFVQTGLFSGVIYLDIDGIVQSQPQNIVPIINDERYITIGWAEGQATSSTPGQDYIVVLDDSNYGVGLPVSDLNNYPINSFEADSNSSITYQVTTYSNSAYNNSIAQGQQTVDTGTTLNDIMNDLNEGGTFLMGLLSDLFMLGGFFVWFLEYWYLWVALFEALNLVISLDASPDIFKCLMVWVNNNVQAYNFMISTLQTLTRVIYNIAVAVWNILEAINPLKYL